jgi:putative hydrolase
MESRPRLIDRSGDWHTHSDLVDGTASPSEMADAALARGLRGWGLSDHVRGDTTWLPEYIAQVRALRRDGLRIRCGVEATMLDTAGRLDAPAGLDALDYVLIADHQFPGRDGPLSPRAVNEDVGSGRCSASAALDQLVSATTAALANSPTRPVLAHLFSILPRIGLTEEAVTGEHLRSLAAACLAVGAAVEVNEKWRCPSLRVLRSLELAGVRIVAGSDAYASADVGNWRYVQEIDPAPVANA